MSALPQFSIEQEFSEKLSCTDTHSYSLPVCQTIVCWRVIKTCLSCEPRKKSKCFCTLLWKRPTFSKTGTRTTRTAFEQQISLSFSLAVSFCWPGQQLPALKLLPRRFLPSAVFDHSEPSGETWWIPFNHCSRAINWMNSLFKFPSLHRHSSDDWEWVIHYRTL